MGTGTHHLLHPPHLKLLAVLLVGGRSMQAPDASDTFQEARTFEDPPEHLAFPTSSPSFNGAMLDFVLCQEPVAMDGRYSNFTIYEAREL